MCVCVGGGGQNAISLIRLLMYFHEVWGSKELTMFSLNLLSSIFDVFNVPIQKSKLKTLSTNT